MLDVDSPDHTRLRALVHKAFTPRLVEAMRQRVENITDELLTVAGRQGRMDLIGDYALPVPTTIIADMLGIPANERHQFHRWSKAIVSMNFSKWSTLKAIPNVRAFLAYIRKLVRLVAMVFLLLVAGHETTVNLIGNGALALLRHPGQMALLRDNPTLIKSAVEELLRYDGPLETASERYAREDIVIAGHVIPRGALVFAVIASANRNEQQFEAADALDITRTDNRHLAFGQGVHYCLGAPLARLEGQIALNALLRLAPRLAHAVPSEKLKWRRGLLLRGLEALPVTLC